MGRLILGLAYGVLWVTAFAESPKLEFKGVPLGASQEEMLTKLPPFRCYGAECLYASVISLNRCRETSDKASCEAVMRELMHYGAANAKKYAATFRENKLASVSVTIDPSGFDALISTQAEKYAPPSSDEKSTIKNRMNAEFDQRRVEWKLPDGVIVASKRSDRVDESVVRMATNEHIAALEKESAEKAKAAVNKL
jgi:hypothetical protein